MPDVRQEKIETVGVSQIKNKLFSFQIYKADLRDNVLIEGKSPENGRKRKVGSPGL